MNRIPTSNHQTTKLFTFTCAFALLFLAVFPSLGQFAAAAGSPCIDTTDDIYIYTPDELHPTSCYQTHDYSSNDVTSVSWADVGGNYTFNITFQENVNLSTADVFLFFFTNGTYASPEVIAPYEFAESFFIHLNETNSRICVNNTYLKQHLFTPVVHEGKTAELELHSTDTHWITDLQNSLPMDQWFCVGLSRIELDGAIGWDYINWPHRYSNDQLRLPDDMSWIYYVIFGAIALGVVAVVSVIVIRRKRKASNASKEKP